LYGLLFVFKLNSYRFLPAGTILEILPAPFFSNIFMGLIYA
jgi:hypothetical protein